MEMTDTYQFSFFRKPIQNTEPLRAVGIVDIYRYIVGHYAEPQTTALRKLRHGEEARHDKATHFDYCTFSGLFRKRRAEDLLMHSGLMCIDFDHVDDIVGLKQRLIADEYFDTELMFVSPSGDGLKWIVAVDLQGMEHSRFFRAVANYLAHADYPKVDMSGSDVARSCFLPHDHDAFINPKHEEHAKENIFRTRMGECPF